MCSDVCERLTPSHVDQCRDFSRGFRVAVEVVCDEGDCGDHDTKHIQAPEQGRQHVVISILEREAKSHEACDHEWRAEPDDAQSDFRLEVAIVLLDVSLCHAVMKPVTTNFAENGGNNWCKVEEADLLWPKVVKRGQEYREGSVDADYPGECEAIVDDGEKDSRFDKDADHAHAGLSECITKVPRTVLRYTDELFELAASTWLIGGMNRAVVVRLFHEENSQDQDEGILFKSASDPSLQALQSHDIP